jgi:hypothetical protein
LEPYNHELPKPAKVRPAKAAAKPDQAGEPAPGEG